MLLDATDLIVPVRRCLRSDTAVPTSWTAEELSGGFGNPVTAGVFRVSGAADDTSGPVSWRMVLKAYQDPRAVGMAHLGSADDHWNYWRRELDLATSPFFDDLPGFFSVPAVYGTEERADGQVWIWTENVHDAGAAWDEARFVDVAYRVGRFSGTYPAGTPLPANRSLCPDFAGSWIRTLLDVFPYLTDPDDRRWFWEHPTVVRLLGPPTANPLLAFVDDVDRHRAVLGLLPQTLCHRDLWPTNILWPTPQRCVVIDWGMVGPGPVGEDLAQLSYGAYELGIAERLIAAYVAGLRASGWTGPEDVVHYAHEASAAVRNGFLLIGLLHGPVTEPQRITTHPEAAAVITDAVVGDHPGIVQVVAAATTNAMAMLGDVERHLAS